MDKHWIVAHYDEILARGCLSPEQREQVRNGVSLDDVLIQQTSGSSGAPPLRIPRTRAETNWLGAKLLQHYVQHFGVPPRRVAFLGGISHMEADQKARFDALEIRNFEGTDFAAIDAFDPDALSMYPSFAREIAENRGLRLASLRAIKLGGEPILPSDLARLFARWPELAVVEQFGSTEMPGVGFRRFARGVDSGYLLSTDRFDFALEGEGWQPLVVRDRHPQRAFPIEGWFRMDDEVRLEGGSIRDVRRSGDAAFALRGEIDALLARGVTNVQLFPREAELRWSAPAGVALEDWVELGGGKLRARREPPLRLRDSNKLPLVVDTAKIPAAMLYVPG
jgi:hypothetical protein